jgi:hypothetical protein
VRNQVVGHDEVEFEPCRFELLDTPFDHGQQQLQCPLVTV